MAHHSAYFSFAQLGRRHPSGRVLSTRGQREGLFSCLGGKRDRKHQNSPCNPTCDVTVLIEIGVEIGTHSACWHVE